MISFKKIYEYLIPEIRYSKETLKQKAIRSGFWMGIGGIATNSTVFLRTIIYARILTPEIFGLMGLSRTIINSIEALTKPGIGAALVYHNEQYEESKTTAFTIMILRGIILCLITIAVSNSIGNFYNEKELTYIIRVVALVYILRGLKNVNTVDYVRKLNFKKLTILAQTSNIISFPISVFIVCIYKNIWALVIAEIIYSFLYTLLSYILIPGYPKIKFNKRYAIKLFKFGKYISGSVIIIFLFESIDNIIIGKVLDIKDLGLYVFAYSITSLSTKQINSIISNVAFPAFNQIKENMVRVQKAYFKLLMMICFLVIPSSVGIFALSDELVAIVFGNKWIESVSLIKILCFVGALRSINETAHPMLSGVGKPNYVFYIVKGRLVVFIVLLLPLTIYVGLIGACYAGLVALLIESIVTLIVIKKILKTSIRTIMSPLFHPTISSICMCVFLIYLKKYYIIDNIVNLVIFIITGALCYFLIICVLNRDYFKIIIQSNENNKKESSIIL